MIKRILEKKLKYFISRFPAVGITGIRQCGKTTLAKSFTSKANIPAIYLDTENPTDNFKLSNPELFLEANKDKLIIIDEVQLKPEIYGVLRSLIDKNRKSGKYLLLGSASPALLQGSSESLAGRIAYIELAPFNLLEIYKTGVINKHWLRGGFPLSFQARTDKDAFEWIRNLIGTYVERDFRTLGLDISASVARRLLSMIAYYNGKILNISDFSRALGLSVPTIKRYFDFLESAYMIRFLQPYYANIGKRLVKAPKIYIRDTGILHSLLGISKYNDLIGNTIVGSSWEGYVIEQINQLKNDDISIYYYRTHKGTEADIVFVKGGKAIATAEIKLNPQYHLISGIRKAIDDLKTKNNFIINPASESFAIEKDITVCNIKDFLKKYLPNI